SLPWIRIRMARLIRKKCARNLEAKVVRAVVVDSVEAKVVRAVVVDSVEAKVVRAVDLISVDLVKVAPVAKVGLVPAVVKTRVDVVKVAPVALAVVKTHADPARAIATPLPARTFNQDTLSQKRAAQSRPFFIAIHEKVRATSFDC
ncbi:MAG: hypothetical protein VB997_03595, partial [Opitutales bacterium]